MALQRAGCDVAAVFPWPGHPLRKTVSVRTRFRYSALNPLASLARAIREYQPHFVVPADDRAVQHLHELYAAGPNAFRTDCTELIQRSLGAPSSYPIVSSRFPLLEIAQEEGLRVPKTMSIRSADDLESLRPQPAAPWVLKSDGSWGGHGVAIARDAEEARRYFRALAKPVGAVRAFKRLMVDREAFSLRPAREHRHHVVAQQFVGGVPANSGFFCWEGNVLADIHVRVLQSQGDTGAATVVRVIDNPEMALAAKRLAGRLGLSGFFGLDFILEEDSGAAYLLEMNPRCTPLCHLQLGDGRDMVGALRAQLTGEPIEETAPVTQEDTIIYFPQAWHWDRSIPTRPCSYHDVPWEDPGLIRELLLLPWPDRGILARLFNRLRHTTFTERAAHGGGIFEAQEAAVHPTAPPGQTPGSLEHLPSVIPLRREGTRDPLFLIHGVDGNVYYFHQLIRHLEPSQPVYGVLAQALLGEQPVYTRLEDMAQYYLKAIQAVQPQGPYHLVGYSFGGYVAYEIARQLQAQGERVGLVGLIDNRRMTRVKNDAGTEAGDNAPGPRRSRLAYHWAHISAAGPGYAIRKFALMLSIIPLAVRARFLRNSYKLLIALHQPIPAFLRRPRRDFDLNWFAAGRYAPQPYPGKVTLFQAGDPDEERIWRNDQWLQLAGEGVEVRTIPGSHVSLMKEPQVELLAKEITDCLSRTQCGSPQFSRS
jgi:thioesterase domain-containing protein